jgi:hypothetical protein
MIVFGWNSFRILECKPSKIGMAAEYDQQFTIERRQKYFHLFWIPFFGIGQIWTIKKQGDDKLYEPTPELHRLLEAMNIQSKTPWYTFSLFFLLVGGGILFSAYSAVDDYSRNKRYEASLVERKDELSNSINNPEFGTFFKMEDSKGEECFLKVIESNKNSITCLFSKKHSANYSEHKILEAFIADSVTKSFDTITISKNDMLKTINEKDNYGFKGSEVIKGAGNVILKEMKVVCFPVFKTVGSGYQEGEFFVVLQNIGGNGKFKEFVQEKSNMELTQPLFPQEVKSGESVVVTGSYVAAEPFMQGKVKFESSDKKEALYECYVSGTYLSFKQAQ